MGPVDSSSDVLMSSQIGSYFGGELCSIDLDQDGEAELLLIGAPLFYGEQRGGRVFTYQRKQVRTRTSAVTEQGEGVKSCSGLGYSEGLLLCYTNQTFKTTNSS